MGNHAHSARRLSKESGPGLRGHASLPVVVLVSLWGTAPRVNPGCWRSFSSPAWAFLWSETRVTIDLHGFFWSPGLLGSSALSLLPSCLNAHEARKPLTDYVGDGATTSLLKEPPARSHGSASVSAPVGGVKRGGGNVTELLLVGTPLNLHPWNQKLRHMRVTASWEPHQRWVLLADRAKKHPERPACLPPPLHKGGVKVT